MGKKIKIVNALTLIVIVLLSCAVGAAINTMFDFSMAIVIPLCFVIGIGIGIVCGYMARRIKTKITKNNSNGRK